MSSVSDQYLINDLLTESDKEVFFKSKRWNYIVDSSSQGGVFPQQIQLNLQTLGAQGDYVDLKNAYVQFPYRVRIFNSGSGAQTPAASNIYSTVLKNGFYHTLDSCQIIIDNDTINMNQKYTNIPAHFKVLTEWDEEALNIYGPTLGLGPLDDFTASTATTGLNNLSINTLIPNTKGFDLTTTSNTAIAPRQYEQNIDATTTTTALNYIAGASNARLSGKSAVQTSTSSTAVNADCYVQFVLVTIKLSHISPAIQKMPPVKNLKGFIYLNHNSSRVSFTTASTSTISSWSYSSISGSQTPVMLINSSSGFQPASGATNTWTLEASVSGVPSTNLTSCLPPINYCRLVAPVYEANPDTDASLSITKSIRYNERYNNYFNINANGSFSGTITIGLPNIKGLLMVPYFTNTTNQAGTGTASYDPVTSPFEVAPASTSVIPLLRNLQVIYGNKPVFTQPVNMSYELFLNEISELGNMGNNDAMVASGLLNEKTWSNLYRYHYVDLSRRSISDENQSKSILVSCENGTNFNMNVLCFVFYEREFTIDTATCTITRGV